MGCDLCRSATQIAPHRDRARPLTVSLWLYPAVSAREEETWQLLAPLTVTIVGTAPAVSNAFDYGELRAASGEVLGTFVAVTASTGSEARVVTATEITDATGLPALRVLLRPYRPWAFSELGTRCLGQSDVVDGHAVPLASFRRRSVLSSGRLRIGIDTPRLGRAVLTERRARGQRQFSVVTGDGVDLASIEAQFDLNALTTIEVRHETSAPAAWRVTNLALAVCLPAFGVGGLTWGAPGPPGN